MAIVTGQAYGFTALSPIRTDLVDGVARARLLRERLAALPTGAESPFARIPTMHFARWVVVDTLPYEGFPARNDVLASAYLLFVCDFDGALADTLNLLATATADVMDALYAHCVDYPGTRGLRAFGRYLARCQVDTTFLYGSYPDSTLDDVLHALALQHATVDWLADVQHHLHRPAGGEPDAGALLAEFRRFADRVDAMAPRAPGAA